MSDVTVAVDGGEEATELSALSSKAVEQLRVKGARAGG